MVFKLVRTDAEEPCKIKLPQGRHLIGRGKFLDCDDKRVSRNHGELEVTDDTVTLKALHVNPCFVIKKATNFTDILKQNCIVQLTNGDKFGVLPDLFWYELLHCSELDDGNSSVLEEHSNEENSQMTEELKDNRTLPASDTTNFDNSMDEELLNFEINENEEAPQGSPSLLPVGFPVMQSQDTSTIKNEVSPQEQGSPSLIASNTLTTAESAEDSALNEVRDEQSPSKRSHSPVDSKEGIKKVKVEPDLQVDPDAQPGPSGEQRNQNPPDTGNGNAGTPPSPVKPNGPGRERCMYGANCYRKNPAHKAQFCHPPDADWGAGPRAACPWGAGCSRRDPRHWRDHTHPPGAAPPRHYRPDKKGKNGKRKSSDSEEDCGKRATVARKKRSNSSEDSPETDLIVTGKRVRKTIRRPSWSGLDEDENEDPFQTDESDEWVPGNETQSQYTEDF